MLYFGKANMNFN